MIHVYMQILFFLKKSEMEHYNQTKVTQIHKVSERLHVLSQYILLAHHTTRFFCTFKVQSIISNNYNISSLCTCSHWIEMFKNKSYKLVEYINIKRRPIVINKYTFWQQIYVNYDMIYHDMPTVREILSKDRTVRLISSCGKHIIHSWLNQSFLT